MWGLNQTLDIESIRASDAARCRRALVVEARRPREDPQILAVRRSDDRPRIVLREADDPVVAPDEREERQPGRREAHLQPSERAIIDDPCDPTRLNSAIVGAALVEDVEPAVGPAGIAGAHIADALSLKPIG